MVTEPAQCRLEVTFGVDQKVRADHHRFPRGKSLQHFNVITGVHADFYRARLEPALALSNQHQLLSTLLQNRRFRYREYLVFAKE